MFARPDRKTVLSLTSKLVVLAILVTMAVHSSASTPSTFTVPSSIDATGTTDVTGALNSFIGSVPNGSVIAFQPNGRYRIEGTLLVDGRSNLTFDGAGALLFAETNGESATCWSQCYIWPRSRSQWRVNNSSGITFRNMAIRGSNPYAGMGDLAYNSTYEGQHGFNIGAVDGLLIEDVTITDVWGDFINFIANEMNDVVVRRVHMERNGRQGISVSAGRDILIDDIWMSDTRRASIDIEPLPWAVVDGVTIQNSYFGPGRLNFLANAGHSAPVKNVVVRNNVLDRQININVKPPDGTVRRGPYTIEGNVVRVESNPCSGCSMIGVRYTDGLTVRDNVVPLRKSSDPQYLVSTYETCHVTLSGNQYTNATAEWNNLTPSYPCPETTTTTTSTTTSTTTTTTTTVPASTTDDSSASTTAVYRVNVGGSSLAASPSWTADTSSSPSPYVNSADSGNKTASTSATIDMSGVPTGLPQSMFQTERWDPSSGTEMMWAFPVTAGTYDVTLFFAETYSGVAKVGARVFDVAVEGATVLDNYDVFADVGANKAVAKSFTVTADSTLDIAFTRVVENPMVKGIEIRTADPAVTEPAPDEPAPRVTETFSGSLNKAWSAREYQFTTGPGQIDATVAFTGDRNITVELIDPEGHVTSMRGASPVRMSAFAVLAGQWVLRVSGSNRANFTATVEHPAA